MHYDQLNVLEAYTVYPIGCVEELFTDWTQGLLISKGRGFVSTAK